MQLSTTNCIIYYKPLVDKSARHKIGIYRRNLHFVILLCYAIGNNIVDVTEETFWQTRQKSNIFQQNTLAAISAGRHNVFFVLLTNVNTNWN